MIQDNTSKRKLLRQLRQGRQQQQQQSQQPQQQKPTSKSPSSQKTLQQAKDHVKIAPILIPSSTSVSAQQQPTGDVQSQLATMCSSLLRNEQTLLQMLQNQMQQQTIQREG